MNKQHLVKVREQVDQFTDEGICDFRLCFRIKLYFPHFLTDAEGVLHFFQTSLPLIRDSVRFYDVDGRRRPKKIASDAFDLISFWSQLTDRDQRDIWGLQMESGSAKGDRSDRAFMFFSMYVGTGTMTLCLPAEFGLGAEGFDPVAYLTEATGKLRFLNGTAGFGVNIAPGYPLSYEEFPPYALSRRYRGIEFDEPDWFSSYATQGIPYVNWLTLLGEDCLGRVGGADALAALADTDMHLHPLAHGLLIQAGAAPSFGDVNHGDTLEAYRKVGRALAPLRVKTGRIERYNGVGGQENTQNWLARFDQ